MSMANDISRTQTGDAAREQGTREQSSGSGLDKARQKTSEAASEAAQEARRKAESNLDRQKQRATERFDHVSSALRETSQNLRDHDEDSIAGIVDSAAEQVDRLSHYVGQRSVGDLVDELEDIARREPALFLGGAALLGIVGARFLKSSGRRGMRSTYRGDSRYGNWERGDWERSDWDRDRSEWEREDRERLRSREAGRTRPYDRDYNRPPADLS